MKEQTWEEIIYQVTRKREQARKEGDRAQLERILTVLHHLYKCAARDDVPGDFT